MESNNGLWALERNLVVDPHTVVFSLKCLFTGEPVERLTVMTLAQVEATNSRIGTLVKNRQAQLPIPISDAYRRSRAERSKKIGLALVVGGVLAIGLSIVLAMRSEPAVDACVLAASAGVLALIVGICFPYLDDMNGSKFMSGIRFLDDGRILIPNVHESVLAELPRLKRGFFDGFLGNESLKEAA